MPEAGTLENPPGIKDANRGFNVGTPGSGRLHGEVSVLQGVVQHLRISAQGEGQVVETSSVWGQA